MIDSKESGWVFPPATVMGIGWRDREGYEVERGMVGNERVMRVS